MTEGHAPHTAAGRAVSPDQDTTALPYATTTRAESRAAADSGTESTMGAVGAKIAAAGSAAVSAASTAATSAKDAIKSAASESENRPRPGRGARGARQPRRARLTLSHVNIYSVFKFSCVLAIALFFVWLIMIGVLYGLLDVTGVLNKVNDAVQTITGESGTQVVTGSVVFGAAIIIGAVNIVLFIAISTIGSMVYNVCADLVGGAEVTLSERE